MERPKLEDYLKGRFEYDDSGQMIHLIRADNSITRIADLRGWGEIQQLFKLKDGGIHLSEAGAFQDEVGQWIADVLNDRPQVSDRNRKIAELKNLLESEKENSAFAYKQWDRFREEIKKWEDEAKEAWRKIDLYKSELERYKAADLTTGVVSGKYCGPLPWRVALWGSDFIVDADGEIVCQFFDKEESSFKNKGANRRLIIAAVNKKS